MELNFKDKFMDHGEEIFKAIEAKIKKRQDEWPFNLNQACDDFTKSQIITTLSYALKSAPTEQSVRIEKQQLIRGKQ